MTTVAEPVRSTWAPVSEEPHLLTAENIRNELALYDDTSQDDLVLDYELHARTRVEAILGMPIRETTVTDHYEGFADRLVLSHGWKTDAAPVVKYHDTAGVAQTLAAAAWLFDGTGEAPAVVVVDPAEVHSRLAAPVNVAWVSRVPVGAPVLEAARQAARIIVASLYEHRGTGIPPGYDAPVLRILHAHRRFKGVLAR